MGNSEGAGASLNSVDSTQAIHTAGKFTMRLLLSTVTSRERATVKKCLIILGGKLSIVIKWVDAVI